MDYYFLYLAFIESKVCFNTVEHPGVGLHELSLHQLFLFLILFLQNQTIVFRYLQITLFLFFIGFKCLS